MARTLRKTCQCCGLAFMAGNPVARWCSSRCSMRAYQRRRRGVPEADARPRVVQPTIVDDDSNLPDWARACMPPAGTEERIWQGTAIQRRQADGFVNATAMCKAGGKLFADYARLARTQEYMAALVNVVGEKPCGAAVAGNPITGSKGSVGNPIDLIHTITTGPNALRGTWIHPRLAIDLARWISPAFAVWMDGWFLESLANPAQASPAQIERGIHIVASSKRDAHLMWTAALRTELVASLQLLDQELFGSAKAPPAPVRVHVPA